MTISGKQELDFRQIQAGVDALAEGFALFNDGEELVFCNTAFRSRYSDLAAFLTPGMSWAVFMIEAQRRHGAMEFDQLDAHLSSGIDAPLILEACERGTKWLRMGIHPVNGGGFVLTESDMTDQQQAHEIIEHADDLLRNILDACASRIVLSRISDGRILYRTPAWQADFGETQQIQDTFVDVLGYSDLLTDLLSTGRVDNHECTLASADASPFPARQSARMIDYQGESAIVISTEDMTHMYAQREEILRINQRLLDAIEALDQGFVLFDKKQRMLMANQRYLDVNRSIADTLVPGTSNATIVEQACLANHQPLAAGWPIPEKLDRDTATMDMSAVNEKYEFNLDGDQTFSVSRQGTSDGGFVIAWRDISEQRKIEQELHKRREEAFQNEKLSALGQLLAGVAHELNNPLSVVLGHAMMLRDEVDNPEALDGIDKISRSAQRCAKIVKTFLAMARQRPAEIEQVSINDVVAASLDIASFGLNSHNIVVDLQLGEHLPLLEIDETQVIQVFINLMVNAEHALSGRVENPMLRITTSLDASTNQLITRISDNGPGISIELQSRIFEPFFTTKAVNEGTGVGLALSHRIISSHSGRLELVDSELGGATFEVSLPASHIARATTPARDLPGVDRQCTALVIDDEPDVSDMFKKLLTGMNVSASIANSAEQGLRMLEADASFDLILCDLKMPGIDGAAMLQEIDRRWPLLSDKFVFVTGDAISAEVESIRRAATHPLLEKPVSPTELLTLVRSMTQRSIPDSSLEAKP